MPKEGTGFALASRVPGTPVGAGVNDLVWKIEETVESLADRTKKLGFDLRHDVAMAEITISLRDDLMVEVAQMARDEHTTEAELVRDGIERLIHSRLPGPSIPRFARRLGPLAIPESRVEPCSN
jgi:hypothetical protein